MSLRKSEVAPVATQTIAQISTKIIQLRRRYREVGIFLAKRDISRAFKLVPVRPRLMVVLRRAFSSDGSHSSTDLLGVYLSLPVGRVASPGCLYLVTQVIQEIQGSFGQQDKDCGPRDP